MSEKLPKYEIDFKIDTPPLAVGLGERAVALRAIMDYLNQASRARGSASLLEQGGGPFKKRYGRRADKVQQGAERKTSELYDGFREGVDTLTTVEQLRAHGYPEDEIELHRIATQAEINRELGIGKSDGRTRARVVAKAKRAAEIVGDTEH